MKKLNVLFLALSMISVESFAAYKREPETCVPMNQMRFEAGTKSFGSITEAEFNLLIDKIQSVMSLEVKKRMNKKLIIEGRWNDSTVDAFATRDDENNPVVVIHGGLARHPKMTRDGLLLLACHELGHHLGGAPKIPRGNSGLRSWSSAEGQADYFATNKCLPLFFNNNSVDKIFDNENDNGNLLLALSKCRDNICARVVLAGLSVSQVFASLVKGTPEPSLMASDSSKVQKTIYNHPNPQCRLDTYFSGALCEIGVESPFDAKDPSIGACTRDIGIRPSCWFYEKDF